MEKVIGGAGGCFRKGTQVQLEGGRTIAIEKLNVGDEVLSFDENGQIQKAKVVKLHVHTDPQPILEVRFWRGRFYITPNHWVLNQYNSFVEMGTLSEHDALVDGMGHLRPILGMEVVAHEEVYNLTVFPNHTFIADGIRVHNGGHRETYPVIGGAGGGGKGGGGGRAAVEDPDSLRSRAMVSVLDLLGEGEIGGLVNGAKSIFLDETVLQNEDGSYNFSGVSWDERVGTQDQESMPNFSTVESPSVVNVQVKKDVPVTFSVLNSEADYVRVIMSIPSLMKQDTKTGDIKGTSVKYKFAISKDGGPFNDVEVSQQWLAGGTWYVVPALGIYQAARAAGTYGLRATFKLQPINGASGYMIVQPEYDAAPSGSPPNWQPIGKQIKLESTAYRSYNEGDPFYVMNWQYAVTAPVTVEYENTERIRIRVVQKYIKPAGPLYTGQDLILASVGDVYSYTPVYEVTVSGKSRSKYQRAHMLKLPKPASNWNIRVTRTSADSSSSSLSNDTWVDSYVEIVDQKLSYPNSALVGITIDSAQFSKIPARAYLVDGLYIKVPANYDPITREYTGIWNGTFKLAVSDNPAWVMYDILTSKRYGLGEYIDPAQIDTSKLYLIGKYCDELVPDGAGNMEPRFTINVIINEMVEAYRLLADLAAVFRGMPYWSSMVSFTQDSPADPSVVYSQANVIDGVFSYTGSSLKDKHSVVLVRWNDPKQNYRQAIEYIEDRDLIDKFGVRKLELSTFGCSSRGQAARVGRWVLYTEKYESNFITFKVGSDSAMVLPGEVVRIADRFRAGRKMAGRLKATTNMSATLDAPVTLNANGAVLSLRMPDGSFVDRTVMQGAGTHETLTWTTPLATQPTNNAMFLVAEASLQPVLARVVAISEVSGKSGEFEILALEHNPSKYDAIEQGLILDSAPTSDLLAETLTAPSQLEFAESQYLVSSNALGNKLSISWAGKASYYEFRWRCTNPDALTNWESITTSNMSVELMGVSKGTHEFTITSVSSFGKKSATTSGTYTVLGNIALPENVINLYVEKRINDLLISWGAVSDIDLKGYEIRVGDTWDGAEVLVTNYQGNTFIDDRERGGSYKYMVRAIDFDGQYSAQPAEYVLTLNEPVAVEGFDAIQNGDRIEFKWYANPESDVTFYELREGETWGSSVLITQTQTTTYSMAAAYRQGDRKFWIKAVVAPGIYSITPTFVTTAIAKSNDRNVVFTQDEHSAWTGTKVNLNVVSTFLEVQPLKAVGEYNYRISLPTKYLARNIVDANYDAVIADTTRWMDASYTWASPAAGRMWTLQGDANAISTENFISKKLDTIPASLIEGFTFESTMLGVRGTNRNEALGTTFLDGRHTKGLNCFNARHTWNVSVPASSTSANRFKFWFKVIDAVASGASTFFALQNGTPYRVGVVRDSTGFYLSDYPSQRVNMSVVTDDHIFISVTTTATTRRLYVKKLSGEEGYVEYAHTGIPATSLMIVGPADMPNSPPYFNGVISALHIESVAGTSLPALSEDQTFAKYGSIPQYANFRPFIAGDHDYQVALFKIVMVPGSGSSPRMKTLTTVVDVPDVVEAGTVTTSSTATVRVNFTRKFYSAPEVSVALKGGTTTISTPRIVSSDATGFDIEAINSGGSRVVATISWSAKGY